MQVQLRFYTTSDIWKFSNYLKEFPNILSSENPELLELS